MSVFGKSKGRPNNIKRNKFSLDHDNHFTTNIDGSIRPIYFRRVVPGTTHKIKCALGAQFMPTVFPLQSKIRASVLFFYQRGKNLWKDYYDWYFNTKPGLVPPFHDPDFLKDNLKTGSLLDYLGLPTTFDGTFPNLNFIHTNYFDNFDSPDLTLYTQAVNYGSVTNVPVTISIPPKGYVSQGSLNSVLSNYLSRNYPQGIVPVNPISSEFEYNFESPAYNIPVNSVDGSSSRPYYVHFLNSSFSISDHAISSIPLSFVFSSSFSDLASLELVRFFVRRYVYSPSESSDFDPGEFIEVSLDKSSGEPVLKIPAADGTPDYPNPSVLPPNSSYRFQLLIAFPTTNALYLTSHFNLSNGLSIGNLRSNSSDISETAFGVYNCITSGDVPISAFAARTYESIYNAFFRDSRNNPLVINGVPEYNKYLESDDGGKDSFPYQFHYRNWENDQFTSCTPNPQFGDAPLVGLTSTGVATFVASEDGKEYQVKANVAEDGDTIVGVDYQENLPNSVSRSLVDLVTSGISINDFRNVNSYQRYLETSIRRGLKAADQIKAHYNVDVKDKMLDMPEFIGGFNTVINSSRVDQSVNTEDDPLGSYAGQLFISAAQKYAASVYCDQPGYIMGVVILHPVPVYSQTLPKVHTDMHFLDNFTPEFGHIGKQPVLNMEVAANECKSKTEALSTFGYQRPWYDYISAYDECHGLFRTQLRSFLLNRVYSGVPILGSSFTVMKPHSFNNIFPVDDDSDKAYCILCVNDTVTVPIPKSGVSSLEPNV